MERRRGFTLVELLVVAGIISLLISILLPAVANARRQSKCVGCQSNMRQVGLHLIMYANDNRGQMIPMGPYGKLGGLEPREERWPTKVFRPPVWNPPVLICPADEKPVEEHSYILNYHLITMDIRFGKTKGISASNIIVMGEKKTEMTDYHMDPGDFDRVVEQYRHGLYVGSNYFYLDGHAASALPKYARYGIDPWNPVETEQPQPDPG